MIRPMRRRIIAGAWIVGATVPLLLAAVFLVGCCVLPFHGVMHKLMPLCDMAAGVMRGEQPDDHHGQEPLVPTRERQEPKNRLATVLPEVSGVHAATHAVDAHATQPVTAYRSFISLGAVRCDDDVGLHVLVETFLI